MSYQRTPRGTTILLLSAVFISLGLLRIGGSNSGLVYAGIGLFLFYYTSRLVLQVKIAALKRIETSREYPQRVSEDAMLEVSLQFLNKTFTGLRAEVFDSYPPFFRLRSGSNASVIGIPGRGYSIIKYEIGPTSIGKHQFGPVHLLIRDLAGLFFYQRDIQANNTVEVTPRPRELARGSLTAVTVSTYAGPLTSKKKGEGMEFADIREYTHADPYKRIEWKSTARTGQLMVRELHAETQLNVMILLDATETMAYGEAGQTKLDYATRAVASLVAYLSRRGDFFGFTLAQEANPEVVPLGRGQLQVSRIMRYLGRLSPGPSGPFTLNDAVRRSLTLGRIKGRTLFFVLTDLESEGELAALRQLVAMSHEAVIISPYNPLFEAHGLKGLDRMIFSIHTSYQWRTRRKLLHQAAKLGIPLFDVGPMDLFPRLVMRVEEHRRRGGF